MAFVGGMLKINPDIYDILLSITLIWAAYKISNNKEYVSDSLVKLRVGEAYIWGGGIGSVSYTHLRAHET